MKYQVKKQFFANKILCLFLSLVLGISTLFGCNNYDKNKEWVTNKTWETGVKKSLNDLINNYGGKKNKNYVVFDFDNTCSIFDVEEQFLIYQLETMSFNIKPNEIKKILSTGLIDLNKDLSNFGYGKGSYNDWLSDICVAYKILYRKYGPFNADGISNEKQKEILKDDYWMEFATKIRTLYNLILDNQSSNVAYPWVLYWLTGMSETQVYNLAYASHMKYKGINTSIIEWESPENIKSKTGVVKIKMPLGINVSDNIIELWMAFKEAKIDVWVCSASFIEIIKAAIDAFGMHDYVTGVLAMTTKSKDGVYTYEYDYTNGYAQYAKKNNIWVNGKFATKAQTQGKGKVTTIQNALIPIYKKGPVAGFMDSTGDFNFCTEYKNLKLVVCFNRATRKVTDGGGLISEIAMYQKDIIKKDLLETNIDGDTLYVLQGRDENGKRCLRNSNKSIIYGNTDEKLFANDENELQLKYFINNKMQIKDAINKFAIKTEAKYSELGFNYGFLDSYDGYHSK